MSQTKIYVGNLSYDCSSNDLEGYFGQFGEITEVKLIIDRETQRSKGFGFITFASTEATQTAIDQANNAEFMGRKLRVNIANDNPPRGGGRGGGHGGHRNRETEGQW